MSNDYRGLNKVLVSKDQLISAVILNRDDHREAFLEAMDGYRDKAIQLLEEHIERIKANAPEKVYVSLPMPEDHTSDYDRVIKQLEWSLDETLELNEQEFATYVLDQWGWQESFAQTYAMYTST